MSASLKQGLKPRKTPRQARSTATINAIFDATIQVLLKDGAARLTTTRVAERAGVSVGTMYQYFPHKQALLHAILKRHLDGILVAIEAAADRHHGSKLAVISDALIAAYLEAKTANLKTTRALYRIAPELDLAALQKDNSARVSRIVSAALASASDAKLADLGAVAITLQATVMGTIQALLERDASPAMWATVSTELPRMCRAYLRDVAK